MERIKIFIDMDGVLAEFNHVDNIERLYEKGYFKELQPLENVVKGVKSLIGQVDRDKEMEIFILSSVLKESSFALKEKNEWLDHYLPEINEEHRLFIEYGSSKSDAISSFGRNCVLIDDYTPNLNDWKEKGGTAIKMINPVNDRSKKWEGMKIEYSLNPLQMAYNIKRIAIESCVGRLTIKNRIEEAKKTAKIQKEMKSKVPKLSKDIVK